METRTTDEGEPETKRRRLRKGTHSCWECKRRKMKCIFASSTDGTACQACRRRGSRCVTQEFPEDSDLVPGENPELHSVRRGVLTSASDDGRRVDLGYGVPTPESIITNPPRDIAFDESSEVYDPHSQSGTVERNSGPPTTHPLTSAGKYERLSRNLHASLPSQEETQRICRASRHPSILPHDIMTVPYADLDHNGQKTIQALSHIPEPDQHPVLIARHMLLLASVLQHLHPDLHKQIKGLSEPPRMIMKRLADAAISHVTTNDALTGSIELLECVVIESVYQANMGNLRRSWVSCRRAMTIAQLMGLNKPNHQIQYQVLQPKLRHHPQQMWFRVVFLDRFLCLMLGLSQGSLDRNMASEAILANESPMGRLERIHCVIASRILERNECLQTSHDITITRTLDVELQQAARSLPNKWWLTPTLNIASADSSSLFWDTRRLFAQVLHYNLLNQLHLPYLLRFSSAERQYEYSRTTCINASREIISRVITLRSFNGVSYSCRIIDFLVLMAAMTLLLAHLDSHRAGTENILSHQYYSDRAMIEQVQEIMEDVHHLHADALSARSAELLHRLLSIEMEKEGSQQGARSVSVRESGIETAPSNLYDDAAVNVHIPYFGIIKIAREGISKEMARPEANGTTPRHHAQSQVNYRSSINSAETLPLESRAQHSRPNYFASMTPAGAGLSHRNEPSTMSHTYPNTPSQAGTDPTSAPSVNDTAAFNSTQTVQNDFFDSSWQHEEYPGLAAGAEDWAFQGIDSAFFDTLLRSNGNETNEGCRWMLGGDAGMSN